MPLPINTLKMLLVYLCVFIPGWIYECPWKWSCPGLHQSKVTFVRPSVCNPYILILLWPTQKIISSLSASVTVAVISLQTIKSNLYGRLLTCLSWSYLHQSIASSNSPCLPVVISICILFLFTQDYLSTGCSLNIVFFPIFFKYSGLWPFSVFPRCQCVYTHQAGRKPALQQNLQSKMLRKRHNI